MNELYDDGRTRGIDGPVEWARLEAGPERARVRPRACGQDRDGIEYQLYSRFQHYRPTRFGSCTTLTFSTLTISAGGPTEKPKNREGGWRLD